MDKRDFDYYVKHIKNLEPHLSDNYFAHVYSSPINVTYNGNNVSSMNSIFSLMKKGSFIDFRYLPYDEVLTFHDGNSLEIMTINEDGSFYVERLGRNIEDGEKFQVIVRGGILASIKSINNDENQHDFSLIGAVVAPAFDPQYFKSYNKEEVISKYPHLKDQVHNFLQ